MLFIIKKGVSVLARYKTTAAVFALIFNKDHDKILLQKRIHTGINDGLYDVGTAGHVEENESMSQAMARELKEEIGLVVNPKILKFAFMMHKYYPETDTPYFNGYFVVDDYTGEPEILEPNKNAELIWVSIKKLPENLIEDRKIAINNYLNHAPYIEDGWN